MDDPVLRLSFEDGAALQREFEQNLKHGRAYVRGSSDVTVLSDCVLRLHRPDDGAELSLRAQAVMVSAAGVGIELRPFDSHVVERMAAFVRGEQVPEPEATPSRAPAATVRSLRPSRAPTAAAASLPPTPSSALTAEEFDYASAGEDEGAIPSLPPGGPGEPDAPRQAGVAGAQTADEGHRQDGEQDDDDDDDDEGDRDDESEHDSGESEDADDYDDGDGDDDDEATHDLDRQAGPSRHERLRKLSQIEQQKIARVGELNDRVMLERLYGKNVWDALLRNPRLTVPEVARIARKGTVPRPLLELIVDNNSWIQAGAVRRALLSNPRVAGEAIMKLMRITPKHELKSILKSTAYSVTVREAAKKVLG